MYVKLKQLRKKRDARASCVITSYVFLYDLHDVAVDVAVHRLGECALRLPQPLLVLTCHASPQLTALARLPVRLLYAFQVATIHSHVMQSASLTWHVLLPHTPQKRDAVVW